MVSVPEDIKKKIDERYSVAPFSSIDKFLRENPDVDVFLQGMVDAESWFESKRRAFSCIVKGLLEPVRCIRCGKVIPLQKILDNPLIRFCSRKCSQSSPERLEKVRQTSMERYGCANAMQNKDVQNKLRQTNQERYGVDNVFQLEDKKKKIRQTNREKYGSELYVQSDDWKKKSIATNLEKLGVEFSSQDRGVRQKISRTNTERYGGVAPACSEEVVDKMKATNLERYGNECSLNNPDVASKREETWNERYGGNPLANEEVLQRRVQTNIEKYGAESYSASIAYLGKFYDKLVERFKDKVEPLFGKEDYHGINCREKYRWRCCKCGTEFEAHIHITDFDKDDRMTPRCPQCHPLKSGVSSGEIDLLEYVKSVYDGEVITKDRSMIRPLELDIYIPEKKVAIEFDGLYWHSESQGKGEDYHLNKTELCEKNGVRLVHVFEDEWRNSQEIVKDRIKSILGIGQQRIFARKCKVKVINYEMSSLFFDRNHLQGRDNAPIRYGLFCNDELVSVMTFGKPRFNKNYDWELIRFASKNGTHVVGGASKLLASFRKEHEGSIISYADRRYSNGNVYERLGFRLVGVSQPNYWYVKGFEKLPRYACQKGKLPALLGETFNPEWSESENMIFNGYEKIYDCGNLVYVMD